MNMDGSLGQIDTMHIPAKVSEQSVVFPLGLSSKDFDLCWGQLRGSVRTELSRAREILDDRPTAPSLRSDCDLAPAECLNEQGPV